MCHTDVVIRDMPPEMFGGPMVYGHEGAGIVESVGPGVTRFQPGDHVVMSFRSCMSCKSCMDMHPAYCSNIMALNAMGRRDDGRSEEHTSELQSLMSISYAVFCLKNKIIHHQE